MLTLLSPAKTLDFESPCPHDLTSLKAKDQRPELIVESEKLAKLLKTETPDGLRQMMGISESLASLNHERFQNWEVPHPKKGSKEAIFAFQGDVYQGLQADKFTKKQLETAQTHLRILSGLYGVLRPLDRILPYRLEMGTSLANESGKDLYQFWGDQITKVLAEQIQRSGSKFVLNLASNEYFRSVKPAQLPAPVIAPAFKELKNGKYKIISFFAKKARGTMAAWVIRNRVRTDSKLIQFAEDGYRYDAESSTPTIPVFLRS